MLADPDSKPAVIAESQLAAFHIEEQRLVRLRRTSGSISSATAMSACAKSKESIKPMSTSERGLWLDDTAHREDLITSSTARCGSTTRA